MVFVRFGGRWAVFVRAVFNTAGRGGMVRVAMRGRDCVVVIVNFMS